MSLIEQVPNIKQELKKDFNIDVNFERAKDLLEENDGAGNTFKATAKPVLIGTAVVGATTMIFSIIMALTNGLTENVNNLSLLHAPFMLGLITGGAIIYWFTGASTQAVTTGAYRAVEFIKANIKLEGAAKASVADSKKVVEICTKYAQKGMFNIFLAVFFATLAFAFVEPFFFIGYLISIAIFGLYQAIFMANAGAAWDNAKKIVEVELKQKGTPLHDATVVGDTVGDPFKDTSSVALNPVIKFTTLFGLLAVELAVKLTADAGSTLDTRAGPGIFPGVLLLRLPLVLRHADREGEQLRRRCNEGRASRPSRRWDSIFTAAGLVGEVRLVRSLHLVFHAVSQLFNLLRLLDHVDESVLSLVLSTDSFSSVASLSSFSVSRLRSAWRARLAFLAISLSIFCRRRLQDRASAVSGA